MNYLFISILLILLAAGCNKEESGTQRTFYTPDQFVMGADLSFANQILEHGGIFRDSGYVKDPYMIFKTHGANVIRFRLFHNPVWTKEIYKPEESRMYNDFDDVKLGISRAKKSGLQVCLDIHYSDTWADPGHQIIPVAWQDLDLKTLHDSIYQYTYLSLKKLDQLHLMPEYVQPGNEINPGFLLPQGDRWHHTGDFIYLINAAIRAIRDAGSESTVHPKIILHIAQPENAITWFDGLQEKGLGNFDIIGFSYYYMWSDVPLANISNYTDQLRKKYGKEVMVMETAYPWTLQNADNLGNIIDVNKLLPDYPANRQGQYNYLVTLTQEIIDGGGKGIFYWEPDWITSQMKTPGGTGSAWDCNTFFDFSGNTINAITFMNLSYQF
ncbi:MAG: glycosyl hydrolase 53 family protein [Bacteroidales bacterium]|nr:glycosyl hydrolase 53 family protein [Bacteroidales bacterium]